MFSSSWKNLLLIAAFVVALAFFVVWNAQRNSLGEQNEPKTEQVLNNKANVTSSSELPGIEYEFAPPSEIKENIEVTETRTSKPLKDIPALSRAIPDSIRPNTKAEMEQIIGELKKNPSNAALWSELGLYRKESNDLEGARQAWEFAYKLQPENAVIADNLGVLYGYYLKNGLKSEEFFRAAIALEPQNIHLRLRLFELYRDVFEDKAKARTIVEEALKDNPGNEQLMALLKEITEENK